MQEKALSHNLFSMPLSIILPPPTHAITRKSVKLVELVQSALREDAAARAESAFYDFGLVGRETWTVNSDSRQHGRRDGRQRQRGRRIFSRREFCFVAVKIICRYFKRYPLWVSLTTLREWCRLSANRSHTNLSTQRKQCGFQRRNTTTTQFIWSPITNSCLLCLPSGVHFSVASSVASLLLLATFQSIEQIHHVQPKHTKRRRQNHRTHRCI